MTEIYIKSEHLQLAEPLMEKYFDYDSSMLSNEIDNCVERSGINYISNKYMSKGNIDGLVSIDLKKAFREHKDLFFPVTVPYKKKIHEQFRDYFSIQDDDEEEIITEDDKVLLCLTYMSYIYFKDSKGLFNNFSLIDDWDVEYQYALHGWIYPEMLSLYRMILKTKKNRGSKVTITYKQDKIDVNSYAWFLDDMEKYFKERFPDLTLEKINQLLSHNKGKAGRKFKNPIITNLVWGTYQLLYNHHSKFKDTEVRTSKEICQFIADYLGYLNISHNPALYIDREDIKDGLKDMIKRGYTPHWNLVWRNAFSDVKEKQPESPSELINQPLYRYDIFTCN